MECIVEECKCSYGNLKKISRANAIFTVKFEWMTVDNRKIVPIYTESFSYKLNVICETVIQNYIKNYLLDKIRKFPQ